jgi:hypothetical protein
MGQYGQIWDLAKFVFHVHTSLHKLVFPLHNPSSHCSCASDCFPKSIPLLARLAAHSHSMNALQGVLPPSDYKNTSCLIEPGPTQPQGSSKAGLHNDDIPMTHIAVAVEVKWSSLNYPMSCSPSINRSHALGSTSLLSSCLSDIITKYNLASLYCICTSRPPSHQQKTFGYHVLLADT